MLHSHIPNPINLQSLPRLTFSPISLTHKRFRTLRFVVVEDTQTPLASLDASSEAARRLYIGNIPRSLDNAELTRIVEEHGAVEKAEVYVS